MKNIDVFTNLQNDYFKRCVFYNIFLHQGFLDKYHTSIFYDNEVDGNQGFSLLECAKSNVNLLPIFFSAGLRFDQGEKIMEEIAIHN